MAEGKERLRRRVGAWQIGGACGGGDQMATWVFPEPPQPLPASLCASLWASPAVSTHTAARRCGHEGIHSLEFTIPGTDLLTVNE